MSKIVSTCLAFFLLIGLCACDLPDTSAASPSSSTPPHSKETETPTEDNTTIFSPTIESTPITPTEPPHTHNFAAATCTAPKTCSCGATEGNANGHNWKDATCLDPQTCTICNVTNGSAAGHNWSNATCTNPKTCAKCGITDGNANGHNWSDATYTHPKQCSNCGQTEGAPLEKPGKENYHGHVYTGGSSSKKYHYEEHCAGKNSHEITWDEVDRRGLEPCGTCVLK